MDLHGVKALRLANLTFCEAQDLFQLICQQQEVITKLSLRHVALGPKEEDARGWTDNHCKSLAINMGSCVNLGSFWYNYHMEIILSRLQNLRALYLEGDSDSQGGNLTNKTCELVAKNYPYLHAFEVTYHRNITAHGVKRVFESCPNLRIFVSSVMIQSHELKGLLHIPPKLIIFGMENPLDINVVTRAVEGTKGRILFGHLGYGAMNFPGLSRTAKEKYNCSKKVLCELLDKANDHNVYNEWEEQFGK